MIPRINNVMTANTIQRSALLKTENRFPYRDLNKNGKLDIYEDPRQPIDARVKDLLGQMTLQEKAGLLFINAASVNQEGSLEENPGTRGFGQAAVTQMSQQQMSH